MMRWMYWMTLCVNLCVVCVITPSLHMWRWCLIIRFIWSEPCLTFKSVWLQWISEWVKWTHRKICVRLSLFHDVLQKFIQHISCKTNTSQDNNTLNHVQGSDQSSWKLSSTLKSFSPETQGNDSYKRTHTHSLSEEGNSWCEQVTVVVLLHTWTSLLAVYPTLNFLYEEWREKFIKHLLCVIKMMFILKTIHLSSTMDQSDALGAEPAAHVYVV